MLVRNFTCPVCFLLRQEFLTSKPSVPKAILVAAQCAGKAGRLPAIGVLFLRVFVGHPRAPMITSWPGFQFTGVATWCLAVSCDSNRARAALSSKLRPVLIGYISISLIFLSGPHNEHTVRTVAVVGGGPTIRRGARPSAGSMSGRAWLPSRSGSPIIG